jgi:hypothetical protein
MPESGEGDGLALEGDRAAQREVGDVQAPVAVARRAVKHVHLHRPRRVYWRDLSIGLIRPPCITATSVARYPLVRHASVTLLSPVCRRGDALA